MFRSNEARKDWAMKGPFMPSEDVFHMAYDSRGDGKTYAAVNSMWFGPTVQFSDEFGQPWEQPEIQPVFPSHRDMSVNKEWHLEPGRFETPGELYWEGSIIPIEERRPGRHLA